MQPSPRAVIIKSVFQILGIALSIAPTAVFGGAGDDAVEKSARDSVLVTAPRVLDSPLGASSSDTSRLAPKRSTTSDSARLLEDVPGVSLYGAGGISSLPVIRGLADDRIRTQVDGVDLMTACPNHMNSALSYINPTKVGRVTVFAGATPVSVGGDSIGGTIQVESAKPEFADPGKDAFLTGQAGSFYRSNGHGHGYNLGVTWVGHDVTLSYDQSNAWSDNYTAGKNFKAAGYGSENSGWLAGDVVGSTAYSASLNQDLALAWRHDDHLLEINIGRQTVGFEGFPNQRMDMTYNKNTLVNIRYTGQYRWGELEARVYEQKIRHRMDMGRDRYSYGTGMPMESKGDTRGALLQGNIALSETNIIRLGAEYQDYTLYDWWPPVGGTMGPNTFWNIDYGRRDKIDAFAEWEKSWSPRWVSQLGIRSGIVKTNAAAVQGYDNGLAALWGNDAAAFNGRDHDRVDHNWDVTNLLRYTPAATQSFEAGYARKSRSPNLYQRYPWSTQAMAALMNNFVGDGNGYIGNGELKPETADTVSFTADWHDAAQEKWGLKTTAYYTHIRDYIDAQRCHFSQCSAGNATATESFVLLQYVNQSARLYGLDSAANRLLGSSPGLGSLTATGVLNYVRGQNRTTGDDLYNIMPLNLRLALVHRLDGWSATAEVQLVKAKTDASQVRNEIQTDGYGLFNLRCSYEWRHARVDVGVENVFNRFYSLPLGGAYVGQGPSMTSNGIAWGTPVPGMGRSINAALNVSF